MSWAFAEATAEAAITYIEANGAAKLTSVAARYSDGIPLPAIAALRLSDPWLGAESEFPVVYFVPEESRRVPSAMGMKQVGLWAHRFLVAIVAELSIDQGRAITSAETIRRMMMRYVVAILEMLAEGYASMGHEWGVGGPTEVYYDATITDKERNAYLGDARIVIWSTGKETSL